MCCITDNENKNVDDRNTFRSNEWRTSFSLWRGLFWGEKKRLVNLDFKCILIWYSSFCYFLMNYGFYFFETYRNFFNYQVLEDSHLKNLLLEGIFYLIYSFNTRIEMVLIDYVSFDGIAEKFFSMLWIAFLNYFS